MYRLHAPEGRISVRDAACSVAVMLLEVDSTTPPHPRTPHLMCDARLAAAWARWDCFLLTPRSGSPGLQLMRLVSYLEIVELVPVEGRA
jgi:hypothetical protein